MSEFEVFKFRGISYNSSTVPIRSWLGNCLCKKEGGEREIKRGREREREGERIWEIEKEREIYPSIVAKGTDQTPNQDDDQRSMAITHNWAHSVLYSSVTHAQQGHVNIPGTRGRSITRHWCTVESQPVEWTTNPATKFPYTETKRPPSFPSGNFFVGGADWSRGGATAWLLCLYSVPMRIARGCFVLGQFLAGYRTACSCILPKNLSQRHIVCRCLSNSKVSCGKFSIRKPQNI